MSQETSPSGSPIYRYKDNALQGEFPNKESSSIDEITQHIEHHLSPVESVFHEIVSDELHIDLLWIKASKGRPYHTIITSGMSDMPMNVPNGQEGFQYAELLISLPTDWPIDEKAFENEDNYWPFRWLKLLARLPHNYQTWLGYGHTVPNGDPAEYFSSNTKMSSVVVLPPVSEKEAFWELKLEHKTIHFYALYPIYEEELNLKMNKGVEKLIDLFESNGITEILNPTRLNTAKKRKKVFGLF